MTIKLSEETTRHIQRLRHRAEMARQIHDAYVLGVVHGAGRDLSDLSDVTFNPNVGTLDIKDD